MFLNGIDLKIQLKNHARLMKINHVKDYIMRIVTASITTTKNIVTVHMELIKPYKTALLTESWEDGPYRIPRARELGQYAHVEQRVAAIHAKIDSTDAEPQRFLIKRMHFTLSSSCVHTLQAIYGLDSCFKLQKADIILIDDQATFAKFIPELLTVKSSLDSKEVKAEFNLPVTLNEFIRNKQQTKAACFNQDLIARILSNPENKQYEFLSAFYLLDPEKKERATILKNLSLFLANPQHGTKCEKFMKILNGFARDQFIQPCIGKIADDGCHYNHQYTEIETFDDSQFTLTEDRIVQINPLDSWAYKEYYVHGKRNFGKLKAEWIHMGKILGIEFSEDSIWDVCIILTKESSDFFIQKGLLYDEKFMEDMKKQENLEKIMLFRHGFFGDNQATNRQLNADVINKITQDFVRLSTSP